MYISKSDLVGFLIFKTSRSGGKGGQNVNKVSSKVELLLPVKESGLFNEAQLSLIYSRLSSRITKEDCLQVFCEEERSQYLNKEKAIEKLIIILSNALRVQQKRKATKPTKSSIANRLDTKRKKAEKKANRQKYTD